MAVENYHGRQLHRIDEHDVRRAYQDSKGRNAHSEQAMVDAFLFLEDAHQKNRAKGLHEQSENFGQNFVIGDKGQGKTQWVNLNLVDEYGRGRDVFSSSSLLYGFRLTAPQVYAFPVVAQPGIAVYIDETHEWAHAMGGMRKAQQIFENATAELRKLNCDLWLSTVLENRVSGVLRHETSTVFAPYKYVPKSAHASARANGNGNNWPLWCYVAVRRMGPYPWHAPGLAEEMGLVKPRKIRVHKKLLSPFRVYQYSKFMNSFERGRIGEGRGVDYDEVEDEIAGRSAGPSPWTEEDVAGFHRAMMSLRHGGVLEVPRTSAGIAAILTKVADAGYDAPRLTGQQVTSLIRTVYGLESDTSNTYNVTDLRDAMEFEEFRRSDMPEQETP